jgi:hypothetical protein
MKKSLFMQSNRGAAFMTVLLFLALLFGIAAAVLSLSTTENKIDKNHKDRLTARNAAEALAEYGAAQGALQVQQSTEYSATFCDPDNVATAFSVPPSSFFAGTQIDPATVEVVGKVTPPPAVGGRTIAATDPANSYSSLRGVSGKTGSLTILARASTVPDSRGKRESIYISKTYTIMDAPVLQYAAFYNMDLEVAPGPTLNIYGPVHTNRDLWVSKQSSNGNTLNFWEAVTVVGKIQKGFKVQPYQSGGTREVTADDPVQFMSPSGSLVNLYGAWGGPGNKWRDQLMGTSSDQSATFKTFSNATYGNATTPSNLQTSAHGVLRRPLPGQLDNYVPDPNPTDGIIDPTWRNVPRALIERPLQSGDVEYVGPEVEKQKMSRKAGLYIVVNASGADKASVDDPSGTPIPGGLKAGEYRAYVRNPATSTLLSPVYTEVKLPGQPLVSHMPTAPDNLAHTQYDPLRSRPIIIVRPQQMVDMRRSTGFNYFAARSGSNTYQPKRINIIEVDMTALKKAVDFTVNGLTQTSIVPYETDTPLAAARVANSGNNYFSTYRSSLAQFGVTTNLPGPVVRTGNPTLDAKDRIENMSPSDWDGSIYIESVDADFLSTADPVTAQSPLPTTPYPQRRAPGNRASGVRLINGRGPIVSASATRLADTTAPCSPGLTLSTNDALYILGHLNADGNIQTTSSAPTAAQLSSMTTTDASASGNNSSLFPDPAIRVGAPTEQPLALVADAITILSQPDFDANGYQNSGWCDALSDLTMSTSNWLAAWASTPPAGNNQTDGNWTDPGAGNKWVFTNAASQSPLDRYKPGTDANPKVSVGTGDSRPSINIKFPGEPTEISAGFIVGLTPSAKNPTNSANDGQNSGGLHNLPRFLENWGSSASAIRGSMVVMFESQVAWEPWSLRVYGPPNRQWGFHNFFRNLTFSDDIPATRNVGVTSTDTFQLLTRSQYVTQRDALWPSHTFASPP